jgi:hypothetical protein
MSVGYAHKKLEDAILLFKTITEWELKKSKMGLSYSLLLRPL